MVGPKFEPELMSWLRSFGSFGTVFLSSFGSVASDPRRGRAGRARTAVEVLRLREGLAEQRRADDLAVRPRASEPFALSEKPTCAMPVTTSGYAIPSSTVKTTIIMIGGQELASHHFTPRAVTSRSMSLMPMNGATIPPSP